MADKATAVKTPAATPEATAAAAETKEKKPRAPRAPVVDPNLRIKVLATTNPKRPKTKSYERFAVYKDGMTVEQFSAAVEKIGQKKGLAIADIRYDLAHKFIELRP
jgi:hypothetical protein